MTRFARSRGRRVALLLAQRRQGTPSQRSGKPIGTGTGAIYKIQAGDRIWHQNRNEPAMQTYAPGPPIIPGIWFEYEIFVRGDDYTVFLTNTQSGERRQTTTFHNTDGDSGRAPGFIGVQVYPGSAVAWRHIRIKT